MSRINKETFTWIVYIPIATTLLYFLGINFATTRFFSLGYLYMVFLGVIVSLFPINRKENVFSLVAGVSLAAFVIYGLLPELLVSSVAVLAVMVKSNVKWDQHSRYALNLLMITTVSTVSAGAYYWTEILFSKLNIESHRVFLPLLVYMVTYSIINHLFIYLIQRFYLRQENVSLRKDELFFSMKINLLVFPLTFILIFLYFEMGSRGIILGSLPFLMVTLGYSFWGKDQSQIRYLTLVTKASQQMASEMNMKKVKESFVRSLLDIFPAEKVYFYRMIDEEQVVLERVYAQNQSPIDINQKMNIADNFILKQTLKTQSISAHSLATDWVPHFENNKEGAESAIILPVHISTRNKGVLIVTHQKRSVFDEYLVSLVEILHQYFITVLESVNHYEKLEALHRTDHLTGLLNLRGFSEVLDTEIKSNGNNYFSMIILDLDHFKKVNDTHGHEAGNEVLSQLGEILKEFKRNGCSMARYGGEEFVVLLKSYDRVEAFDLAEEIRKAIEQRPFEISQSIKTREPLNLSVTASLGVATYPDDCQDLYDLMQLADKAMSLGSKKSGRNKVTAYHKGGALNEKTD